MGRVFFFTSLLSCVMSQETPSLGACWAHGYQVILSYADPSGSGHEELWPAWDYWWANKSDPNLVISYLEQKKKTGRPGKMGSGLFDIKMN